MGIPCAGQVNDIFELKERVNAFELKMLANLGLVEPIGSMINKGNKKLILFLSISVCQNAWVNLLGHLSDQIQSIFISKYFSKTNLNPGSGCACAGHIRANLDPNPAL